MKTQTFTNKMEYMAYCFNWKLQYKQLSNEIRELKKSIRVPNHQITWQEFSQLHKLKVKATKMLEERNASKVEAQCQYLSAHGELVMA